MALSLEFVAALVAIVVSLGSFLINAYARRSERLQQRADMGLKRQELIERLAETSSEQLLKLYLEVEKRLSECLEREKQANKTDQEK